jgi:hypothetical protein
MTVSAIREKLHSYIDTADLKKVKAIYTMLEDSITEDVQWNKSFKNELDSRYNDYKKTGISVSEKDANKRINHILKKGKIA